MKAVIHGYISSPLGFSFRLLLCGTGLTGLGVLLAEVADLCGQDDPPDEANCQHPRSHH